MSQGLIQGSMREAPLPDIIQLVSQGGKTGCFHVSEEPKRARIYLNAGRIVHALTRDSEGLDALYEVALWLDGSYHFEEAEASAVVTITKPNPSILMEMHRRMDEWRVISQKIGSLDLHPNSTLLPGETPKGVNPREARLLEVVTGFFTVGELAAFLGKPVLSVAKDLYGLVMAGHVTMQGVRSGRRPEPAPGATALEAPAAPVLSAEGAAAAEPEPEPEPLLPTVPEPMPVPDALAVQREQPLEAPPQPRPLPFQPRPVPPPIDPVKLAKLTHFSQRIVQTAKSVLPAEHHEMLNKLLARTSHQLVQGEGPEAVKNLALAVSRGAVDAGCDGDLVKNLNSHLKALFAK